MKFGTKAGEAKKKGTSQSSGEYTDYIRYFRDKETRLRFLEEMDQWTEVWMHFNNTKMRSYPCTDDFDTCPGHQSDNERERKPSKKYLVNALSNGYVNLYMLPGSLWDDMDRHADKAGGTVTDRDFTIIKKDTDAGVRYAVDREERDRIDLSVHDDKKRDHQKMLRDAYIEVWGALPEAGEENQDPPRRETKSYGDDAPSAAVARAKESAPTTAKEKLDKETAGDPPTEPASQSDEEEQEISEDQLRAMSAPQIQALFRQCGLAVPESDDPAELADQLIAALA